MIQIPKIVLSCFLLVVAFPLSVTAQEENLIGKWKVKAETPEGENSSVWEFARSGGEITGTSTNEVTGIVSEFDSVEFDGEEVSFSIDIEMQGNELQIDIEAKISADSLDGNWTALDSGGNELAEGALAGKKVAQKKSKSKVQLAGQWDSVAVLPDGTESEAVVALTEKSGKLSGTMDGQNGKTTFESISVKGKTVLFSFQMDVGGGLRDLEIEAEVQKDGSLAGEWILLQDGAEAATGDWFATRKESVDIIFDGKSLDNFRGYKQEEIGKGWSVSDGMLMFDGSGGGDIITKKEYGDFELTFEWKISEGGNSGVMYRVGLGDNAPYLTGVEYQILDNDKHQDGKNRSTSAASLYALYAPGDAVPKAVGEWNTSKIVLKGNDVEHWLNGEKVVAAEFGSDDWNKKVAASKFATWKKFAKRKTGHVAFQDHGDKVWYRNIKIKSMD